jgi:hypothetical protein
MDMLSQQPLTGCLMNAALAAGTTTTISTTGTTHYAISGKAYSTAAKTNAATPTTDSGTGAAFVGFTANNGTVVVVCFDSTGAVKAVQGSVVALDASGAFIVAPQMPNIPDGLCPIGYIVLKGASTLVGTFTFGSSNLSGVTGMTYTFVSLALGYPGRPQVS